MSPPAFTLTSHRKRRAHPFEDPPSEPVLQDWTYSSAEPPALFHLNTKLDQYTPQDFSNIYVELPLEDVWCHPPLRESAASYLNVSVNQVENWFDSSNWHNPHKRQRLSTPNLLMAPNSGDLIGQGDHEKSPLSGDGWPGWTSQRLAQCFSSLCSPCDPAPSYRPLPQTPVYEYGPAMAPVPGPSMAPVSPQERTLTISPSNQASVLARDDSAAMARYYPPLQPTRVVGMPPSTTREEMVYPVAPSGLGDGLHHGPNYTAPGSHCLMGSTIKSEALSVMYGGGVVTTQYGASIGELAGLQDLYGLGLKDDTDRPDGPNFDTYPAHRNVPARRGAFKDQELRAKTAQTRKMGSCIRCKMQRIRCNLDPENENGPCIACRKVNVSTRIYRLNCLRLKIVDCKLYKPGQVPGHEWTSRWKDSVLDDIEVWAPGEQRTIRVTEGYTSMFVELRVREFVPQPGDKLERTWVDKNGVKQRREIPPFAIVDLEDAKNSYSRYIKRGLENCCMRLLGARDKLLHRTYFFAISRARDDRDHSLTESERGLLGLTLDLWMTARLTTKTLEIIGNERLGMPLDLINDPTNDMHRKTPVPPVLGAQIDSFLIHQIQSHLRRKTLEELQKMTQEKKQKTWLTTYLVTFILLHNIGLVTKHDANYARKHGMKVGDPAVCKSWVPGTDKM
ncbi:hypothetical protein QC763_0003900 [Podospora pseudopauciseta]|uniref:Zn(2)-C6 fungal-type domain-containing protein n=2 Tax=Podospora TaxID=5144 RepID=A0ABR0HXE2_9PEZI|nr:hypothetical protein QC763_0003900 [Podospora pseudopauciseta]KAK4680938.1 hypothetical protein QC764_0003910 [Podospora pseudoanserina]